MADPYSVVRNTIKNLRDAVTTFDSEQIITEYMDIWSCKKIIALYLYIKSYLTIMRKNGFKRIHYADLFSGSGLLRIQDTIMPGTPLIPLIRIKDNFEFDSYFFSDIKKEYVNKLEKRAMILSNKQRPVLRVQNYNFDIAVNHIFSGKWPTYNYKDNAWLVTVDPFGMEISWDKITRILGSGSVDMLLTFMTDGFQRNRNVARSERRITNVFGNENWKNREDWVELYREQIQGLDVGNKNQFQTKVIAVEKSGGNKYHLIFISTSEGGGNSFDWIQEHIDQVNLDLLRDAFRGGTVEGSDLDYFIT